MTEGAADKLGKLPHGQIDEKEEKEKEAAPEFHRLLGNFEKKKKKKKGRRNHPREGKRAILPRKTWRKKGRRVSAAFRTFSAELGEWGKKRTQKKKKKKR